MNTSLLPDTVYLDLQTGRCHRENCSPQWIKASSQGRFAIPISWCITCFPGNRCTVCGRPSGEQSKCSRHKTPPPCPTQPPTPPPPATGRRPRPTRQQQSWYLQTLVHRVLGRHAPYERCPECPPPLSEGDAQ